MQEDTYYSKYLERKYDRGSDIISKPVQANEEVVEIAIAGIKELEAIKSRNVGDEDLKKLVEDVLITSKTVEENIKKKSIRGEIINFLNKRGRARYIDLKRHLADKNLMDEEGLESYMVIEDLAKDGIIKNPFEIDDDGLPSLAYQALIYIK